ncbi:MAG: biopolymer transporter ExbD [Helicobacteraceae bacterium]|jgi:biopolymer transport protein ExbD|nr:biopolymer transporter ExbD [Helicobacteraceae bacterium]
MRKRRNDSEAVVDMTPMLDIVFIMLIFFIVTASFVKESGISVNSPSAATAQTQDKGNIMIAINEAGEVWIDGRMTDIRALKANVTRLKALNPEGAVIIQADASAKVHLLVEAMDQARQAGVENVSIAARRK